MLEPRRPGSEGVRVLAPLTTSTSRRSVLPVPDRRRGGGGAGDDLEDRLLRRTRLRTLRSWRAWAGVGRALEAGATPVGLDAVEMRAWRSGYVVADEDYVSFETDPIRGRARRVHRSDAAMTSSAGRRPSRPERARELVTLVFEADGLPEAPGRSPSTAAWWERSAAWSGRRGSGCWGCGALGRPTWRCDGAFVDGRRC